MVVTKVMVIAAIIMNNNHDNERQRSASQVQFSSLPRLPRGSMTSTMSSPLLILR